MTKAQIIETLYCSKNFNDCVNRMEPDHLREDLKAEVAIVICELPDEKIIGLSQRNELHFFVARIIFNMIKSNTSPFYKKFRSPKLHLQYSEDKEYIDIDLEEQNVENIFFNHPDEIADRYDREIAEDLKNEKFNAAIAELEWYDCELINLYKKLGTYRAIEKETGIPFESVYKSIQKSLKQIRCKVLA